MNPSKLLVISGVVLLQALAPAARAGQSTGVLQGLIDAAAPGAVINVPAGTYEGSIVLKDGITLAGEGAGVTTVDGNGAAVVVRGARNATLMGLTIRNGLTGVGISETSMQVFECAIRDFKTVGILVDRGCAVIANNLIEGGATTTGIWCKASNPYVAGTTIKGNAVGAFVSNRSGPSLVNDVFLGNGTAILVSLESLASLESNVFDQNGSNVTGQAFGASDAVKAVAADGTVPHQGGDLESYSKLTELVLDQKLSEHSAVIYDLRNELGRFSMTALSAWANFAIAASAADTEIIEHSALDLGTDQTLHSERLQQALPTVAVVNPEIQDVETERYALNCVYAHPPSYSRNEKGQLLFKRLTNITRVEVVVPPGYVPVSASHPATIEPVDDTLVVKITEVGPKCVEILMDPVNL